VGKFKRKFPDESVRKCHPHDPDKTGWKTPDHWNVGKYHVCTKAQADAATHPDWIDWEKDAIKLSNKTIWKGLLMVAMAMATRDAYGAGEGLGETISGPVAKARLGLQYMRLYRWLED